ncbi:hypothetical protein BK120_01005 [Paenibacillus sp. FSL A5-0031]|uniref:helix-turn-helix domain-containing protein n=1 Tax=Paenibacillus sp. FSL A5-0031 TaxID=1920420 RepID=UPI00096FB711|nr:AraC family transcriptional regulator [Paenibacillus sp. FSL A5-0031]OME87935.1 hypothetical protein BK120_01005 [Paenibacillus sp. FSL A5-0031]
MRHQFKLADVHEYIDLLSEGMDRKLSFSSWEQRLDLPESVGRGFISRMKIRPGMEILVEDLFLRENLKLYIEQECQVLGLAYQLSGEVYCEWNGTPIAISNSPGNTVFFTDHTKVYHETSSNSKSYGIKVRLRPEELSFYFEEKEERERLVRLLNYYKNTVHNYAISPEIAKIVSDMLLCTYQGPLKRLYMESKALELILLFVHEHGGVSTSLNATRLQGRNDLEKLHMARQVIVNHLEHPRSIHELSKIVGLSTTKLKKGFRELFGMTIFELVREQRLIKGAWLMETNQMKVCEAAIAVGYSNPSNFATAFRKHYGCNPSDFLQQAKQTYN